MTRSPLLRWAVYVLVAILFAITCAFLSNWQFSRNAERAGMLERVDANYDAAPVPLGELIAGTRGYDPADEWRPVTLTGEYLPDDQLLVRNRPHGGTSAFEVVTPFRLDDGRIIAVNRGWVPPADDAATPSAVPAPPAGEVTVVARLQPGEPLPSSGRSAPEGQLPTIHLPSVAEVTGAGTVTDAYGRMVSEDPAPAERPNALDPPTEDPGPHLSYAVQWILFAVMGFVFIGYIIRTEIRARRETATEDEEPGEAAAEAADHTPRPRRPLRRPRSRDRDAEEEDAILDSR